MLHIDRSIETTTSPDREVRDITIERLSVTDATLLYDAEGSDLVSYEEVNLTLDWPDPTGTAEIAASIRPSNDVVQFTPSIDRFSSFIMFSK